MYDDIRVRIAREEDAAAILAIYAPYVITTAVTFEYEIPAIDKFANRIRQIKRKYPLIAAEVNGKIVGYAYAGDILDGTPAFIITLLILKVNRN